VDNLENILNKVRGLLAKADSTNFPEEAKALRAGAEALMFKYRLDESQLTAEEKAAQHFSIQWRDIVMCTHGSKFTSTYYSIMSEVCLHMDVKYSTGWETNQDTGELEYVAHVCGYGSDLAFVDVLFTSAALAFRDKLEPQVDPSLSDQENAYRLRMAGMGGREIALKMYGKDDKHLRPKVRKMFADEAVKRGEDPAPLMGKGVNVKLYQESFAQGFRGSWAVRLMTMRSERGSEGGLVLAGRKDAIAEAFYDRFPHMRPKARIEGETGIRQHVCPKCQAAKSGYCRDHAWLRPKMGRARVRYANPVGVARGQDAARSVDIGGPRRLG
jgi:hypothetical protein